MKKKNNRWIYYLLAALALLLVLAFFKSRSGEKGIEVTAEATKRRDITETVTANGRIYPETEVAITSDVSGTLVEVFVQEGDSVKEGQLLCRIDADAIQPVVERTESAANAARAQVQTFQAQLRQSEAQLENARQILTRNEQLYKDQVISEQELDNARAAYKTALAALEAVKQNIAGAEYNVRSADATVKESRENLARASIYAPMSGVVSKLSRKKGEQVVGTIQMAGTEIMRIANMRALEIRVDVNENQILRVNEGDTADIEVDAYLGRTFKGIVTHIANTANNLDNSSLTAAVTSDKVTNFTVRIHLLESSYTDLIQNGQAPFRPGMSATASVRTRSVRQVVSIPIQAVTTYRPDSLENVDEMEFETLDEVVFVQSADTVRRQSVKTGIQDRKYIEVTTGLNEGETVVTGPYRTVNGKLKQGDRIRVVKEKDLYKED